MDEGQLRIDMDRARRAQVILEDELVKEALALIRFNVQSSWEKSKSEDKEGRESAWRQLKALNEFERHFQSIIQNGKMAQQELSRLQEAAQKVKQRFNWRFK